ncbi:MAG TPA: alpha-L-fucosidase [Puia sp.]|nr:alpha-L-fucosidase [Puia sp.]
MKKSTLLSAAIFFSFLISLAARAGGAGAPRSSDGPARTDIPRSPDAFGDKGRMADTSKMDWWNKARFGMFIHWGVYSVPGGIYQGKEDPSLGEWIMQHEKIPVATYREYAKSFNPTEYDPESWVLMAQAAGMKYIVITSKHHDGFAMFDSKASDWNIVKATPYGKDILKLLAEACRKHGMKLGFYYSQANDWNNPGGAAHKGHWDKAQDGSMDEYIDKVAIPQVREILTNYGDVAELWWDVPTDMTKERAARFLPLLSLQPNMITNDRLGGGITGDLSTPEQHIPATGIPGRNWEACMTMNDTWGYKINDHHWKSGRTLVRNLIETSSKGGNYLLNVGPEPTGKFPAPITGLLKEIGAWMKVNSESIYGTVASPFERLPWGRCTSRVEPDGNTTLYLHVYDWPASGELTVPGLTNRVLSAKLLANGSELKTKKNKEGVLIDVPPAALDTIATVIKLEIRGKAEITKPVEAPPNTLTKAEKRDGWRLLFDGKTSGDWVGAHTGEFPSKPGGWIIKDSMITIQNSGGEEAKNVGDIVTKEQFSAFDLSFEFRLSKGANSGVKYFVTLDENTSGSAIGLEYQILDDKVHPDAKLGRNGNRTLASLYDLIPAHKPEDYIRPIGAWNTGRIVVYPDNRVEHYLNGFKVLEYVRRSPAYKALVAESKYKDWKNFGEADQGHILLQDHGFEVSFRSIKIKTLK